MDKVTGKGTTLVVGVGNRMRRDDGVGLVAVEELRRLELPALSVALVEGECFSLLDLWQGAATVYVVDAVKGPSPGTIHRIDAKNDALPACLFGTSSHSFGVPQAVELARALDRLPSRLILYGVAGRDFSNGEGLSQEVSSAVPALVDALRLEVTQS